MAWKYIMVENHIGDTVVQFPVIFPDKMVHSQVYSHLKATMPGFYQKGVRVVSAGTIEHIDVRGLGGGSETLSKTSRPKEDKKIIEAYEYAHGIK